MNLPDWALSMGVQAVKQQGAHHYEAPALRAESLVQLRTPRLKELCAAGKLNTRHRSGQRVNVREGTSSGMPIALSILFSTLCIVFDTAPTSSFSLNGEPQLMMVFNVCDPKSAGEPLPRFHVHASAEHA